LNRKKRCLAPILCLLVVSCYLDGWGWLFSSDVDDRYADNQGLPLPAGPGTLSSPFSFVMITDTHVLGNNTAVRFTGLRDAINAAGDSFVIVCGDLVQNGALADFETYADEVAAIEAMSIPVYSVPGNHDLYHGGWEHYRDLLGRSMYSLSINAGTVSLLLVAVDSANGTLGRPQRKWLEDVLDARIETHCVTFTHFQFFSDEITNTQQWTDQTEIYSLMHLLETSGVDIHFSGHSHKYLARTINGTAYVTGDSFMRSYIRVTVTPVSVNWEKIPF
jgi:3',5'-cyclic AMP phosphodiesterase CpdA